MSDVFLSYAREDQPFAQRLTAALGARNREVWVDLENIIPAARWREEIQTGIADADAVAFIITPDWSASTVCQAELDYAVQVSKRLIPILARQTPAGDVPLALAELNWLPFQDGADFEAGVDRLVEVLDTDIDRVHLHTRLLTRALEWNTRGHDRSLLLRGGELKQAETWLADQTGRKPAATTAHAQLILASRRAVTRRQRGFGITAVAAAVLMAILTTFAFIQRQTAVRQRDVIASDQLALRSRTETDADPVLAKLESVAAWRINPSPQSRHAMLAATARPDMATLAGHSGWVLAVAYSPDGKTLASAGDDNTIRLWDTATRSQIGAPLAGDKGVLSVLAFSPDGRTLAAGGFDADDKVRLWDVARRRQVSELPVQASYTSEIAFSRDGRTLAVAENDGSTLLWEIATSRLVARLIGHTDAAMSVEYSPDGRTLATSGVDGTVRLWDALAHRQLGRPIVTGDESVNVTTFSPDGKMLASAGEGLNVQLWDVATQIQIGSLSTDDETSVSTVVFAPDGKTVAAAGAAGTIRLWDTATRSPLGASFVTKRVSSLAFSPDGTTLASADFGGAVRLWNARPQAAAPIPGHTGSTNSVAYSPDGRILATVGDDNTVRLWDTANHLQLALLSGHTGPVTSAVFSPDGKWLATTSVDGSVRLWDSTAHHQAASTTIPRDRYFSAAFSPDSKTLAVIGDGPALLWEIPTGSPTPLPDSANSITVISPDTARGPADIWIAYSPDGRTLATAHGDEVLLWDTSTRQQTGEPLKGHVGRITSLAFSPDGMTLATGSKDQTARLWNTVTHNQIGTPLTGHTGTLNIVSFSHDSCTLATAADDGVRLWDVSYLSDDLPRRLCTETSRSLTHDEWSRYVSPGPSYRAICP